MVTGANAADAHLLHVDLTRDANVTAYRDISVVNAGDACPRCNGELCVARGIEVGHVFKLGTKFSESMKATFLNPEGQSEPAVMGCYGIGVGRLMASVVENSHDEFGPIWPKSIAPFQVEIVSIGKEANSLFVWSE